MSMESKTVWIPIPAGYRIGEKVSHSFHGAFAANCFPHTEGGWIPSIPERITHHQVNFSDHTVIITFRR
jgi:hypothetical protein